MAVLAAAVLVFLLVVVAAVVLVVLVTEHVLGKVAALAAACGALYGGTEEVVGGRLE